MTEIPFDTMAAVRRLRESGIKEEQAEAITHTMRDVVTGGVATKADLAEVKADLAEVKADLAEVKTDLNEVKTDIIELKAEMKIEVKWLKLIGGAILVVLILPWLAEIVGDTMPGGYD